MVVRKASITLIKAYRSLISPMLPASCRFSPSCSVYTLQAIEKYGLLRGGWMGALRLMRCHPFSKGGFDPVK